MAEIQSGTEEIQSSGAEVCGRAARGSVVGIVLNEQVSMSRDDLLRETANKLGYTRLGSNVLSSMNHGFAYAEAHGAITLSPNGAIILSK